MKNNTIGVIGIVCALGGIFSFIHADNVGGGFNFFWGLGIACWIVTTIAIYSITAGRNNKP